MNMEKHLYGDQEEKVIFGATQARNAVEAIMPDYKKAKKWLNKNGYKLRNL